MESPQERSHASIDYHDEYHERESDEHCGPERAEQERERDDDDEWATPRNPRVVVVLLYACDVHRHQVHHFSDGRALSGARGDPQRLAVHCSDQCGAHPECGLRRDIEHVLMQQILQERRREHEESYEEALPHRRLRRIHEHYQHSTRKTGESN